ncbi:hypothetical protein WKV44_03000 [Spirochaetia bacterium 38H-sp]|uniref:Uncharacterized protein n=1 Tax=Rarispira pelagica TaxID=3141764 RepID=A0ABU9UAI3_9SPIR
MTDNIREQAVYSPAYARLREHEREAFLSQLGTFSPVERELFHSLCMSWRAEIPYTHFVDLQASRIKNVRPELDGLMDKLYANRYGTYVYELEDGQLEKKYIVLTEQNDYRFCYYVVRNTMYRQYVESRGELPLASYFAEHGFVFPEDIVVEIDESRFVKDYLFDNVPESFAVMLSLGKERLYITPDTFNILGIHCRNLIISAMENTNFLADFARYKNTTLSNIKTVLSGRSTSGWLDISSSLVAYDRDTGDNKRILVAPVLFIAARVLHVILKNQIEATERKKKEESEKKADFEALCEQLREQYKEPVSSETFMRMISVLEKKYGERFEAVKKEFLEKYSSIKDYTKLPPVIYINKSYIHKHNLYAYTAGRFEELSRLLFDEYSFLMEEIIRTNNKARHVTFISLQNLEEDLKERVAAHAPFIAEILSKPRLFAEIIIDTIRHQTDTHDLAYLKRHLERYFLPNSMKYKPLVEIFAVDVQLLFDRAFSRLGIIKQIIWYITGRYGTYKERFNRIALRSVSEPSSAMQRSPEKKQKRTSGLKNRNVYGYKTDRDSSRKTTKVVSAPQPLDKEKVWNEFERALRENNK